MLLLLADHVPNFLDFYPEVPKKIVEVLARTLVGLTPRRETTFFYMNYQKTLFGEAKEGRPSLWQGYHGHVDPWERIFRRFWCWFCTVVRTTVKIFVLVPFLVPVYRYGVPLLQSLLRNNMHMDK